MDLSTISKMWEQLLTQARTWRAELEAKIEATKAERAEAHRQAGLAAMRKLAERNREHPHPLLNPLLDQILPRIPNDRLDVFLEAVADLTLFDLMQPSKARGNTKGVQARQRQWRSMSGGLLRNYLIAGLGAAVGLCVGIGLTFTPLPFFLDNGIGYAVLALAGAAGGGWFAHKYGSPAGYMDCMMQLFATERESVIRPQMGTGQIEIWVPKALAAWRAHDWRYRNGKPFLWLQLAQGERVHDKNRTTMDYLVMDVDDHRSEDASLYSRRTVNRMVSDEGVKLAEYDVGDEAGENPLMEFAPYVLAAIIILAGIIMVLVTS